MRRKKLIRRGGSCQKQLKKLNVFLREADDAARL